MYSSEFVYCEKPKIVCRNCVFGIIHFFECDSVPPKPRAAHWKPESKPSHFALSQLQLGKARVHANCFARCIHIGLRFCRSKSKILRRVAKLWLAQNGKHSGYTFGIISKIRGPSSLGCLASPGHRPFFSLSFSQYTNSEPLEFKCRK